MRHNDQDNPPAWNDDDSESAVTAGNNHVCAECGAHVPPHNVVRDEDQVRWLGERNTDPYCSTTCLLAAAERYSDYTQGRTR